MFIGDYFTPLVPFYIFMFQAMEESCFKIYNMSITEIVFIFLI